MRVLILSLALLLSFSANAGHYLRISSAATSGDCKNCSADNIGLQALFGHRFGFNQYFVGLEAGVEAGADELIGGAYVGRHFRNFKLSAGFVGRQVEVDIDQQRPILTRAVPICTTSCVVVNDLIGFASDPITANQNIATGFVEAEWKYFFVRYEFGSADIDYSRVTLDSNGDFFKLNRVSDSTSADIEVLDIGFKVDF